jgi:hypothetical protein
VDVDDFAIHAVAHHFLLLAILLVVRTEMEMRLVGMGVILGLGEVLVPSVESDPRSVEHEIVVGAEFVEGVRLLVLLARFGRLY